MPVSCQVWKQLLFTLLLIPNIFEYASPILDS
jgi:hypothetical protein